MAYTKGILLKHGEKLIVWNNNMIRTKVGFGSAFFAATGGTITYDGDYKIHTFTSSGDFIVSAGGDVAALIIGGGAGGGGGTGDIGAGGGGGAGGVVYNSAKALTAQTYSITIGSGGAGGGRATNGASGTATVFDGTTAAGGGGGGGCQSTGVDGACGGGGGGGNRAPGNGSLGYDGTYGQTYHGGAGGGMGGVETAPWLQLPPYDPGGTWISGVWYDITGTNTQYAMGGPIGYNGSDMPEYGNSGAYGSGGIGGGQMGGTWYPGGVGADGAVIIRYKYQ